MEIVVTQKNIDVTEEKLAYLYPNGCSVFIDRSSLKDNYMKIKIKNKDKFKNEILLGYMHHIENEIFPNPMINGFQLYVEGNINKLLSLLNLGNKAFEQYFTYQASSKTIIVRLDFNLENQEEMHYTFNI